MPKKLSSFLKSLAGGYPEAAPQGAASDPLPSDQPTTSEPVASESGTERWGRILARGNVPGALNAAMDIEGAIGVALVDYNSGVALGIGGGGPNLDLEVTSAGNAEVVKAKMKTMSELGIDDRIEDVVITLDTQVHLICPLTGRDGDGLFVYVALDRSASNLAIARRELHSIEGVLLAS
jgi:hypothetical protein